MRWFSVGVQKLFICLIILAVSMGGGWTKKVQFENKEPFRLDIVQPGGVTLILYTLSLSQIFNEPYKDRGYFGAGGGGFGSKKVVRLA